MAVNEQFYGSRDTWVAANALSNRSLGESDFFDRYYPPMMRSTPTGMNDGRLIDFYDAGLIDRQAPIDDSPTYTYTDIDIYALEFTGKDYSGGTPTDWDNWSQLHAETIYPDISIMLQTFSNSNGDTRLQDLRGIDGTLLHYEGVDSNYCDEVSRYQNYFRYAPMYEVPDSIMEEAIVVANQEEQYQITAEQVTHDPQYVFVQNTQHLYKVKNTSKLDSSAGYTFLYSQRYYYGCYNRPIVTFCPKNFILSISVKCRFVWTDDYHVGNNSSMPSMNSNLGNCSLKYFLDNIQAEIDKIEAFNATADHSTGYYAKINIWSVYAYVYGRNGKSDDFTTIFTSNTFSTVPQPTFMFNNVAFLGNIFYNFNQSFSVSGSYTVAPIFGGVHADNIWIERDTYRKPSSHNWEPYTWGQEDNQSLLPIVFGLTSFYPRYDNSDFLHEKNGTGSLTYRIAWIESYSDAETLAREARKGAAKYGLFFCDEYSSLSHVGTPKMWADPEMMCGTIDEEDGRRKTFGDYTSGLDNMSQPQFKWVDSEGNSWNPDTTFLTVNNEYPQMTCWNLLEFDKPPLPVNDVMTTANDYPTFPYWNITPIPVEPHPYPIFVTEQNYPDMPGWDLPLIGACASAKELQIVSIADSVKSIGYNSFRKTQLRKATLADDCTYYSVSFPDGCRVTGGELINNQN